MYATITETELRGTAVLVVSTRDGAQATISLRGGQILHWQPAGGRPWLYLSDQAVMDGHSAIRGGIPVCFPQFANQGDLPKHGLVRTAPWTCIEQRQANDHLMLTLGTSHSPTTQASWPHSFDLELTFGIGANRLDVELAVTNTGDHPFAFTTALHTYLRVDEVELTRLEGLKGRHYLDKLDQDQRKNERHDAIVVESAVDRIYQNVARPLRLDDGHRSLTIIHEQFPDTVVWNPWIDGAAGLADMPDSDFRRMLCVEAAVASEPIELLPDAYWWGRQSLIEAHD